MIQVLPHSTHKTDYAAETVVHEQVRLPGYTARFAREGWLYGQHARFRRIEARVVSVDRSLTACVRIAISFRSTSLAQG